jgi:hypothetical protein
MKKLFTLIVSLLVTFAGCGGEDSKTTSTNNEGTTLKAVISVWGNSANRYCDAELSSGGVNVTSAVVTANSTAANLMMPGFYQAELTTNKADGDTVNVSIVYHGTTYTASVVIPYTPTITSPPWPPSTFNATDPILVQWTNSTNPAEYVVSVDFNDTASATTYSQALSGSTVSFSLPSGTLKAAEMLSMISLDAVNGSNLTGTLESGSEITAISGTFVTVNIN